VAEGGGCSQVDTLRYSSLLRLLVQHGKHVLLAGPTGEGQGAHS
jgi:hypothetical protein